MPPQKNEVPKRSSRGQEIYDYFNSLKTDEEKFDYLSNADIYITAEYSDEVLTDEKNMISDLMEDFLKPTKNIVDENGNELSVLDEDLCRKRFQMFTERLTNWQSRIGREYKKILDSLPADDPNREEKAAYLTKASDAYSLYQFSHAERMVYGQMTKPFDGFVALQQTVSQNITNLEEGMTEEDRRILLRGVAIADNTYPDGISAKKLGLDENKLALDACTNHHDVVNMDWLCGRSLDKGDYADPQYSSDRHQRLLNHYYSINDKEKLDLVFNSSLVGPLKRPVGPYTQAEKKDFNYILKDYFNPRDPSGKQSLKQFDRNMDELASRMLEHYVAHGKYMEHTDLSKYDNTGKDKAYIASRLSPDAIQISSIQSLMNRLLEKDIIKENMMRAYIMKHDPDRPVGKDEDLKAVFMESFNHEIEKKAASLDSADNKYYQEAKAPVPDHTPAIEEAIAADQKEAENRLLSGIRNNKPWIHPEKNITMDSLEKLSNLYEQFKAEDRWYRVNDEKYLNLKNSLEKAHAVYENFRSSGHSLTEHDAKTLIGLYDDISSKASYYIRTKNKDFTSDMDKNRIDIAFAGLNLTNKGLSQQYAQRYNNLVTQQSKKINLEELMERSGRTQKQQKEHEKTMKELRSRSMSQKVPTHQKSSAGMRK